MKYYDIQQNSPEWCALRLGKFTASMFSDLCMTKTTKGYNDAIYRVVFERLTGEQPESFKSDYMERGHEIEPLALQYYELQTFSKISNGGFFEMDEYTGASPDGLVNDDGLIEIKSPKYSTMIQYLLKNELPNEYKHQVQGQLMVTGRAWCDFMAYHPKLKPVIIRVLPDIKLQSEIKYELKIAVEKVLTIIEKIK